MKTLKMILICIIIPFIISCSSHNEFVSLKQNSKDFTFSSGEIVLDIEKSPFTLEFFNKPYTDKEFYIAQIAVLDNYNTYTSFCSGIFTSETEFFSPGTGMAPNKSGEYESVIINDFAHHYLFYSKDDKTRLKKIGRSGKYLNLSFNISAIDNGTSVSPIEKYDKDELFIIIFIDRNLDQYIDNSELYKLQIEFD